jgi:glycine/D-amino acid oxidase-like deaminating enzyme
MLPVKSDIVVIGGGIMGSAAAYFLSLDGRAGSVTVIEPDPTYARATTPAAAGGVRRLFTRPENIQMSQFGLPFYQDFARTMAVEGAAADISFRRQGYLFLTGTEGVAAMERNFAQQERMGVPCELLDRAGLAALYPSVSTAGVALACHSPEDAWIDPQAALTGFRRKAVSLGARYVKDRVAGLECSRGGVRAALLDSGARVEGQVFLNTAGPWAGEVAQMAWAKLPVAPMCRVQHFWRCPHPVEPLPLIKNDKALFLRPEGEGFVGGRPSWEIEPGFTWDITRGYFADYFERAVWPLLAEAVPKFETLKLERSWAGHYSQNLFDGNMILGAFAPGLGNLLVACGFSGHGVMHAPAVGRALAELVLDGEFRSLDLSRMGFRRVLEGAPYGEEGIR